MVFSIMSFMHIQYELLNINVIIKPDLFIYLIQNSFVRNALLIDMVSYEI